MAIAGINAARAILPHLLAHPLCGASWEGFALEQVLRIAKPDEAFFWATPAARWARQNPCLAAPSGPP